jgi:hypothetical protein
MLAIFLFLACAFALNCPNYGLPPMSAANATRLKQGDFHACTYLMGGFDMETLAHISINGGAFLTRNEGDLPFLFNAAGESQNYGPAWYRDETDFGTMLECDDVSVVCGVSANGDYDSTQNITVEKVLTSGAMRRRRLLFSVRGSIGFRSCYNFHQFLELERTFF